MPGVLRSASRQRDKIVFADALQHEEGRRGVAAVDDEVRALRPDRERLAGPDAHLLLGVAQEDADLPLEHVEGVLDVVVVMPGHLLLRRDLQLVDAEAGALRVERSPFDLIEMARVLHRFHDGLLESIAKAPSISPPGTGKAVAAPLGIARNGERPAGLEERLEAGEDLRPAFLHGLQRGPALGKLVVGHGELAYHAHRLDLVSHARGPVLDEPRLEGVHQLLSRNDLDHDAFHARAVAPVHLQPVQVVEPAAALELGLELQAGVVLARELGLGERVPKRPRRGTDVDDVNEFGRRVHSIASCDSAPFEALCTRRTDTRAVDGIESIFSVPLPTAPVPPILATSNSIRVGPQYPLGVPLPAAPRLPGPPAVAGSDRRTL